MAEDQETLWVGNEWYGPLKKKNDEVELIFNTCNIRALLYSDDSGKTRLWQELENDMGDAILFKTEYPIIKSQCPDQPVTAENEVVKTAYCRDGYKKTTIECGHIVDSPSGRHVGPGHEDECRADMPGRIDVVSIKWI